MSDLKAADALARLQTTIGLKVKLVNSIDQEISGTIYSYNVTPSLLVVATDNGVNGKSLNYKFIKPENIKSLEITGQVDESSVAKVGKVDVTQLDRVVKKNKDSYQVYKQLKNDSVSKEGQLIFNTVYKTMPQVKWDKLDIVVMNEVVISPPYTVASVKLLHAGNAQDEDSDALTLVKKIVDGVWLKMESERKGG